MIEKISLWLRHTRGLEIVLEEQEEKIVLEHSLCQTSRFDQLRGIVANTNSVGREVFWVTLLVFVGMQINAGNVPAIK